MYFSARTACAACGPAALAVHVHLRRPGWGQTPQPKSQSPGAQALRAAGTPPTPGKPFRWGKPTALTDYENNGYTFTPPDPPTPADGSKQQNREAAMRGAAMP